MDLLSSFLPQDRRAALATGQALPDRAMGTALFADLSGFTPLAATLAAALGPQRGAEALTAALNTVFTALLAVLDEYGGSVISFSGDAFTAWFAEDAGARAGACAVALQAAMRPFAVLALPGEVQAPLALKVALVAGPVRRFLVGDPALRVMEVLAGATLDRLAAAEGLARPGEILAGLAPATIVDCGLRITEWRADETGRYAVVVADTPTGPPGPPPPSPINPHTAIHDRQSVRSWVLSPVYERLQQGQSEFLAELRPIATLFVRFGGFDYDGDDHAGSRLDSFIQWAQHVLAGYEGHLLGLTVGDKGAYFYGVFGALLAHEDDAARAVTAALALQHPPAAFAGMPPLQIGISMGPVWAGAYGGSTRTYGVHGDSVNLAARLMQAAAPGQVLVSPAVAAAVDRRFAVQMLPPRRLKGFAEPVALAAVGEAVSAAIHLQEPRYARPMVGRAGELAQIEVRIAQAHGGAGQVVPIVAEAGLGKSRLVAEAISRAGAAGLTGYGGECSATSTQTPYAAWQGLWRAFFGLADNAPHAEQRAALAEALAAIDPALLPRLPLLGVLLDLPIPDTALTAAMDSALRKASLEALLLDCLRARAAATPLLLVIEDCHWLDPLSRDLLLAVARAIPTLPVLLLLAARPPEQGQDPLAPLGDLPHYTAILLQPFTPAEARALITDRLRAAAGAEPVPPLLVDRLIERAEGNPFYLEELLNYLHDQEGTPGRPIATLTERDLPPSLQRLILSRIDTLTVPQQITLKVASVIGRAFHFRWLWGVYPDLGPEPLVHSDLDALARLDLTPLDQPEPELVYLFKHSVTREVTYASLPHSLRTQLHEHLAAWLETTAPDSAPVDLLAYHYGQSENTAKQRDYFRRAGEAAAAAYAHQIAADYYTRLLPLLPPAEQAHIWQALGDVRERTGAWPAAATCYQAALDAATAAEDAAGQAAAALGLGIVANHQSDYAAAATWLQQAQAGFAALADTAGTSRALNERGRLYELQGEYTAAQAVLAESLALQRAQGHTAGVAATLYGLGTTAYRLGDVATSHAYIEECLALRRAAGDQIGIARALNFLGILAWNGGDFPAARALWEESLAQRRALGDMLGMASSLSNLGTVAWSQGDLAAARRWYEEALHIGRELGDRAHIVIFLGNLGGVALDQGDLPTAAARLAEGLALGRAIGARASVAICLVLLAGTMVATQPARAAGLLGAGTRLLADLGTVLEPLEQGIYDRIAAQLEAALGPAYAPAFAAGQALAWEQAVAYALDEAG
jgi:class 3 adenylate cyclase/tetratricopeptide (TPR) repeat protein